MHLYNRWHLCAIKKDTATHGPSILALAQNILELAQDMTKYFQANHMVAPTFALDSQDPADTAEYRNLHAPLKTSPEDLQCLVDGTQKRLRTFCCTGHHLGAHAGRW